MYYIARVVNRQIEQLNDIMHSNYAIIAVILDVILLEIWAMLETIRNNQQW